MSTCPLAFPLQAGTSDPTVPAGWTPRDTCCSITTGQHGRVITEVGEGEICVPTLNSVVQVSHIDRYPGKAQRKVQSIVHETQNLNRREQLLLQKTKLPQQEGPTLNYTVFSPFKKLTSLISLSGLTGLPERYVLCTLFHMKLRFFACPLISDCCNFHVMSSNFDQGSYRKQQSHSVTRATNHLHAY